MGRIVRNACRAAFAILLIVEILGALGVTGLTVTYTWLGLFVTLIAVAVGIEWGSVVLRRRWHAELHWSVWVLAFAAVALDAFGDMLGFYARYPWYDQFGHYIGTVCTTSIIFAFVRAIYQRAASELPFVAFPLSLGLAITFGTLYEIEEYLEDYFRLTNRLGDGPDTANDLLMNLLGALTVVIVLWLYHRRGRVSSPITT